MAWHVTYLKTHYIIHLALLRVGKGASAGWAIKGVCTRKTFKIKIVV